MKKPNFMLGKGKGFSKKKILSENLLIPDYDVPKWWLHKMCVDGEEKVQLSGTLCLQGWR